MGQDGQTRRQFCSRACTAAAAAAIGGALASTLQGCGGGGGSPTSPGGGGGSAAALPSINGAVTGSDVTVNVGAGSALAAPGSAALVRSSRGDLLVARTSGTTFSALTAVCTHEGCTITGLSGQAFVCPCHGSRFDQAGGVLNGPAGRPLRQFATQLAGDTLTINT